VMCGDAQAPDISFITLTWNSRAYIAGCVESIAARCEADGLSFEVVVVDNGSTDGSTDVVRGLDLRSRGTLALVALHRNRGTTYSRNLALKEARGRVVSIIDSDTEFLSGSLRPVVDLLAADGRIGIIAPRLLLPDGSVQHSVKRFPTLLDKLRKVPAIIAGRRVPRADFYPAFPFDACTMVETAISACWFFRADLLGTVGLLDEGIFYAPEDVEYSARIHEAGRHILYYPHVTLLHHTQQITHRRPLSWTSLSHLKGLVRYHRRHGGWVTRPEGADRLWPARDDAAERFVHAIATGPAVDASAGGSGEADLAVRA
jgi:GT2 family glycosyltransferase